MSEKYIVSPATSYRYLNQSGCLQLEGVDDAAKFDALRLAFEVVQIPKEKIDGILSVVSAILWLGNLAFQVRKKGYFAFTCTRSGTQIKRPKLLVTDGWLSLAAVVSFKVFRRSFFSSFLLPGFCGLLPLETL